MVNQACARRGEPVIEAGVTVRDRGVGVGAMSCPAAQAAGGGDPLDGDDSGLLTLDGNGIFLYTDTNNNIVLGREGAGTTADPNGDIVFGLYIEETTDPVTSEITGGKIWTQVVPAYSHWSATHGNPT